MTCCFKVAKPHSLPKAIIFSSLVIGAQQLAGQCRHPMDALGGGTSPFLTSLPGLWDKCPPEKAHCCLTQVGAAPTISLHFPFSQVLSVPRCQNCPTALWVRVRDPEEGTGHKDWSWELSFGGAMLPNHPARSPLLHRDEAWSNTMLQPDFPTRGLKGLFIPPPLHELKTRMKTFKGDSQAPAVPYLWVLQHAWCQVGIFYLSGTFSP